MRFVMVMVLAGLVASPRSGSAQAEESEEAPKQAVEQEPAPSSEPAPEEPASKLDLDSAGVEVVPRPPRTFHGYTLEELELRKRRAGLGLIAPASVTAAGIVLFVYGTSGDCYDYVLDDWDYRDGCRRPRDAGMVLTITGGVGMIVGSVLYGKRAKEFRRATKGYTLPEEPALQLELDDAGVEVVPRLPRTWHKYKLEELELRRRRAAFGFIAPAALIVAGVPLLVRGTTSDCAFDPFEPFSERCNRLYASGMALTVSGGVGMIVVGVLIGVRGRQLKLAARDYEPEELALRTVDRYRLEELELRVNRAKIGLYVSAGLMAVSLVPMLAGDPWEGSAAPLWTGVALMTGGFLGMIISGSMLRVRKQELRELLGAQYGKPRRVQWDLARMRLVF